MVAELRPEGADKGGALRRLMAEPPFAGARPVFVGDDLTDEDAFEAASALGGEGVLVGPARPSAARWRLDGVVDVTAWLEAEAYG
jgi:trehalose 6-phosphate phosphatase